MKWVTVETCVKKTNQEEEEDLKLDVRILSEFSNYRTSSSDGTKTGSS